MKRKSSLDSFKLYYEELESKKGVKAKDRNQGSRENDANNANQSSGVKEVKQPKKTAKKVKKGHKS